MLSFNPQMFFRDWLYSPMPQQSPLLFVTENSGRSFNFKRTAQQFFKWLFAPREGLEQPLGDGTRPEELNGWQPLVGSLALGGILEQPCWLSLSAGAELSRFAVPWEICPRSNAAISTSRVK